MKKEKEKKLGTKLNKRGNEEKLRILSQDK